MLMRLHKPPAPNSAWAGSCAARDSDLLRKLGTALYRAMFTLSDDQLAIVMTAVGPLPPEKCSVFLERVAARLQLRRPTFQ